MPDTRRTLVLAALAALLAAGAAAAQPAPDQSPPPPPAAPVKAWSGSVSAGLSLTAGNKNTSNFNVSFDLTRDPKVRNVFKSDMLYLRGKSERNVTGDQLRFGLYDEYRFNTRFFVFGQARYLSDRFKDIDYLVAPATGMGYKVVDKPESSLGLAAGLGGVWEKDRGRGVTAGGSLTVDQKLMYKISTGATLGQSLSALWKTNNFGDALFTFRATLAASLTARAQLKLELLDTYKNLPPAPTRRNDVAVITGLVYKI
jgi:putative salt-induced outer membrane protein